MTSSKHPRPVRPVMAFLLILWSCAPASAVEFAGGTGDPNNPYQIATADQLIAIGSDPTLLDKHYILIADIDLDSKVPGGVIFNQAVIGQSGGHSFTGCLDGRGHTISNLAISAPGQDNIGLFAHMAGGQLKNLGLENVQITGGSRVGALLGRGEGGTISHCHATGTVVGSYVTGELVGEIDYGTVSSCYSAGTVTGGDFTGGLIGGSYGSVTDSCCSSCDVAGTNCIGGLVGGDWGITTFLSYSTGCVEGVGSVGGLLGTNQGIVLSCRSTSRVIGTGSSVGGLVGRSYGGIIATSYSTGPVSGPREVGGLVGGYCAVRDSYFLVPQEGGGSGHETGTPLTAVQMSQRSSFKGWDFWGAHADGVRDEWFLPKDSSPVLVWEGGNTGLLAIPDVGGLSRGQAQASLQGAGFTAGDIIYDYHRTISEGCVIRTFPSSFAVPGTAVGLVVSSGSYDWTTNPGDGSIAEPYRVGTAGELESLADHPELWDKHFVLTADIDLGGRTYPAALIAPDADGSAEYFQGTPFSGTFDGQDNTIANLTILTHGGDYLGLFGKVGPKGVVTTPPNARPPIVRGFSDEVASSGIVARLNLSNARILGGQSSRVVGALVGSNNGTIINCSGTGVLIGRRTIGDLFGENSGVVTDCTADVLTTWLWRDP